MSAPGTPLQDVLSAPSSGALRRELVDLVVNELMGPAGGDEEMLRPRERPRDRYLVGTIAPRGQLVEPELDETLGGGEDDLEESAAPEEAASRSLFPSSIGMSFRVAGDCDALAITARWGRYELVRNPEGEGRVWQRIPCEGTVELSLASGGERPQRLTPVADLPEIIMEAHVRPAGDGDLSVTLFLRNDQKEPEQRPDLAWLFQAAFEVRAADGSPAFVAREGAPRVGASDEDRRLALAYRNRREFAVGHGISVHVESDPHDPSRARALATRAVPEWTVPETRTPVDEPLLAGLVRDMAVLGDASDGELPGMLEPLVTGYGAWIARQRERAAAGEEGLAAHGHAAMKALDQAEEARVRIAAGIELLRRDPRARTAFRFANRAMALQRAHTLFAEERRRGGTRALTEFETPDERSWFPFQLAFVLLNLPALTDPHHEDRGESPDALCDLLWFPTGGGKTEAYLGLSAYTMALRRLQGPLGGLRADAGVAVLMRYTLRVLTLQQFQRAAALLCACEVLRREDVLTWGEEPFRIGLWVGQATTPNTVEQAHEALRNMHGDGFVRTGGGRPDQLASCPWCGSEISPGRDIRAETYERGRARVITFCSDPRGECDFSPAKSPGEGIPVVTVDEEIYRRLPAMVVATVDKFAQLPWNGSTQTLFGRVDGRCERHGFRAVGLEDSDSHPAKGQLERARTVERGVMLRPPDLVIQDELHLISGPLGTLVGLYETAVDRLSSWQLDGRTVRPKVIASTATVRQAPEQVHALFLRRVAVFPPPGLDADDNFFARERPLAEEDPGRLYLGVCAPGRRLKGALIRVYFAFLAAAQTLYVRHGHHADPWMSLVGYFSSIRELAGMRRACEDDVRTRLLRADAHGLAPRNVGPGSIEELTSRLAAADIPRLLDRMEHRFDPVNEAGRKRRDRNAPPRPLDVLLATNMISVGVDVRRLGLMVVGGQPKTTAEYIQATSRVGRARPGIVCTVFNWARPRDLSHYTRFEHYHDTFYRHVEPLSVTPFARRSLDRGLSALLAALVRLWDTTSSPNGAAHDMDPGSLAVREAVEAIARRAGEVVTDAAVADEVAQMLNQRLDTWRALADKARGDGDRLGYQTSKDSRTVGLLSHADRGAWTLFTALDSLRDVESMAGLVLREGPLWTGVGPDAGQEPA